MQDFNAKMQKHDKNTLKKEGEDFKMKELNLKNSK